MSNPKSLNDRLSLMSSSQILSAMKLAVRRAVLITRKIQGQAQTLFKSDASPVTVGDFASQAIITHTLCDELGLTLGKPQGAPDEFRLIAEEDATSFETEDGKKVLELVVETLNGMNEKESIDEDGTEQLYSNVPLWTPSSVIEKLSAGRFTGKVESGNKEETQFDLPFFMCDPIDGTKGFIAPYPSPRHGHYAVGLALLVAGQPTQSVIACPNLPTPSWSPLSPHLDNETGVKRGCLFTAEVGKGAFMESLLSAKEGDGRMEPVKLTCSTRIEQGALSFSDLVLAESFDPGHSDKEASARVSKALGLGKGAKEDAIRIDSMSKYCLLARGDAHLYLRFPDIKRSECTWDHAMGSLLVKEAGGIVTDCYGKELDYKQGRRLEKNYGIIAASEKIIWEKAIEAVKRKE